jgi:hypothetical protein
MLSQVYSGAMWTLQDCHTSEELHPPIHLIVSGMELTALLEGDTGVTSEHL